ncbi:sensor histidine kinase [Streptomyces sp. HD]|uniref:sensor histidine kinase n=1 Tax=Streptomyces sp. HD TaxID=3020892 RepID=UPI00232F915B|nr:sensor histidine kinase [Streptomyces sp. HD]
MHPWHLDMTTLIAQRIRRLPQTIQDAAWVLAIAVLDVQIFSSNTLFGPNLAYALAGYTALVWRRRYPLPVFAVVYGYQVAATLWVVGYSPVLGLLLALYTVAANCSLRAAQLALPAAAVPYLGAAAWEAWHQPDQQISVFVALSAFYLLQTAGAWGIGRWAQLSRLHAADLEYRRQAEAREAVTSERTRIARELHDIVAHSVTVMMLQAAVAKKTMRTDPDQAGQALSAVDELGTQAMGELSRMLAALRPGTTGASPSGSDNARQPGLADLETLLESIRQVGVSVRSAVIGTPQRLDPSVSLTAYRVVQEALTNVTRHAGPGTQATVRLSWGPDLQVEVIDDGGGAPDPTARGLSTGQGLRGLRERVAITGGHLDTGPTPRGGFRVTARLPTAVTTVETTRVLPVTTSTPDHPQPRGLPAPHEERFP